MKKITVLSLIVAMSISVSGYGAIKTYQVTGPVLEVRADAIVVQKGKDRWEIVRDAGTRAVGDTICRRLESRVKNHDRVIG